MSLQIYVVFVQKIIMTKMIAMSSNSFLLCEGEEYSEWCKQATQNQTLHHETQLSMEKGSKLFCWSLLMQFRTHIQ